MEWSKVLKPEKGIVMLQRFKKVSKCTMTFSVEVKFSKRLGTQTNPNSNVHLVTNYSFQQIVRVVYTIVT